MFNAGDEVRSRDGSVGRIAVPSSSAAIQKSVYVAFGQMEETWLVVTADGEVRRFVESALERVTEDETNA